MSNNDRIRQYYEERKSDPTVGRNSNYSLYNASVVAERQDLYKQIIFSTFSSITDLLFIEIGAGAGSNLPFFKKIGFRDENIFANELLDDRLNELRKNFPEINILPGDALELDHKEKFDIVFQSTVFTSILNDDFKKKLAGKMWDMTRKNGIILWYDFIYNNPSNKSVKGVPTEEIKSLFPNASGIEFRKVTLAPPVGRRFQRMYSFLNAFSFLRTHTIAVIHK